jgi:hypothetical protein
MMQPVDDSGTTPVDGSIPDASPAHPDGSIPEASPPPDAGHGDVTSPVEAGPDASDAGVRDAHPDAPYPAFPPLIGHLLNNGGYVMKHPVVVSITWDTDTSRSAFEQFGDQIGPTAYWEATTSEYGIGPATSGPSNHVHLGSAPLKLTDQQLQDMVTANAGAPNGWPAPSEDTIYAFYIPPSTNLQLLDPTSADGGLVDACTIGLGYHDQVTVGSVTTSYAVVMNCTPFLMGVDGGSLTRTQNATDIMSHELIESATDPHPGDTPPGFLGVDSFALDWYVGFYDEAGDLCVVDPATNVDYVQGAPAPFDFWIQRTWSNKAGPAGHDPCQPVVGGAPYFNVTPLHLDTLQVSVPGALDGGTMTIQAPGVHIPMGGTRTIPLGYYSDAPAPPWNLGYSLGGAYDQVQHYLTVSIDNPTGQNGDTANATVTVTGTDSTNTGLELLVFLSVANDAQQTVHAMPVLISSQ